jgi:WD40 repeat protein/predicted Ser/Thr protein kinase
MADAPSDRVEELFHQAADLPPDQQQALLDAACLGEPALRAAVEQLLADDARLRAAQGWAFLDSPLVRPPQPTIVSATLAAGPPLPAGIGRYRILRLLGEGGMGAVYEAEQDNPRRLVALKVIRPGLLTPELRKRFAHEAQLLGRLHHPGIAAIHEAGVAEDGRPFFAMEFIRGLALDDYCRLRGLTAPARLELLARVCDAVQHAHEQGVIHCDLKPGNILVDDSGQPKVLDFGVARALQDDLRTSSDRTRTGHLLGTLRYMSPEQVAAEPAGLDQRSDVYTLGVMLFELLAGRLPYPLEELSLPEAARVIRDQEPSRLSSIDTRLRGDVETIVAKALEKERGRRYASAAELAADLRRHLRHEPIQARPASALYHLRKFARRHKALVGGAAGVLAALLLGLLGTILFAVREAQQRGQAEQNARRADEEKRAALSQTYRARLAAAGAALQNHDVADAARQLKEAPEGLRDWEWQHLHSRLDDSSAILPLLPKSYTFLFCGPEGLRIASGSGTGVRVIDETGRERLALPRHLFLHKDQSPPIHLAIGPTRHGVWIVDLAPDRTMRLRDETGDVRSRIDPRTVADPITVTVSPDRTRLAIVWVGDNRPFCFDLYETASGKNLATCAGHTDVISRLVFSPDGKQIASLSNDHTARVWDAATGTLIAECRGHTSRVFAAAFRPDGARLATTSGDGTVRQWDPQTGREVEPPYERHTGDVLAAVYSPDGQWLASGGTDRTVRLWQAEGRQEVLLWHGHTGAVTQLAFTPDGRRLASVSADGTARLWEADPRNSLPVLRGHTRHVYPVAFSPDGQWIASGGWDGRVHLWDALTGELGAILQPGKIVRALAFGPDGTWLVTGCDEDGRLQIWDVATARLRRSLPGPGRSLAAVAVSPDGTRIAARSREGLLTVSETATGREIFRTEQNWNEYVMAVAYSPDGRWLAGTSRDLKSLCLWDAQTHRLAAQLSGHTDAILTIAFSPDGQRLVSAGEDRTVRVWDVTTGECQAGLHGHTDEVFAAAFHPGGTRLATAGRDGAVWLWDLTNSEDVTRLQGHTNYIWSLAFSSDGKTLVSGSGDYTVRLWDTQPLQARYDARRALEALRPEAERLVARMFQEKKEASLVAQALKEDQALSKLLRRAAFHALWHHERADQ